jgi:murein DD-endopeptidase MepM/ murein hydrolase activator NlpD
MLGDSRATVVVAFPLRGEGWVAVTSPAQRVPSHGTDLLGQRFAFDFIRTDGRPGLRFHPAGALRTLLLGVPTRECFAWGAPVHAPVEGIVVRAVDGRTERARVHPVREAALALWNGLTFRPERLPAILGNHVILRQAGVYVAFAHLAPGSVAVREGQPVSLGQVIGKVGHTGNSTSPHLHVQLMDGADPLTASGLPCAFAAYEVARDGEWFPVEGGIPGRAERIRLLDEAGAATSR